MKKILAILVLAAVLCTAFVACNKEDDDSTSATVTVSVEVDDETVLEATQVTVEGQDGKAPVALDAIIQALVENEIPYKTAELAGQPRLEKIGDYTTENNKYIWELYINGEEAEVRISAAEIKTGDGLVVMRNEGVEPITTEPETTVPATTEGVATVDDGYED